MNQPTRLRPSCAQGCNCSPLHNAASRGSMEALLLHLDWGQCDINSVNCDGKTAVHSAICVKFGPAVKLLILKGAHVDLRDNKGNTPLSYAVVNENAELVEDLIKRGADIDSKNKYGLTPLDIAIKLDLSIILNLMLKKEASVKANRIEKKSLLEVAVLNNIEEDILSLAEEADFTLNHTKVGTMIYLTGGRNVDKEVIALIDKGLKVNAIDKEGRTPLHYAAWANRKRAIDTLIQHGAKTDVKDIWGQTPLHIGVKGQNCTSAIKKLLLRGAKINESNLNGETPLIVAAMKGDLKTIELLLSKGAEINESNLNGETSLTFGVLRRDHKIIELLLSNGAKINEFNWKGETPLLIAAAKGDLQTIELLLSSGAKVLSADEFGQTALHHAARGSRSHTIRLLLEKGADLSVQDCYGDTPKDIAIHCGNSDALEELLMWGGCLVKDKKDLLSIRKTQVNCKVKDLKIHPFFVLKMQAAKLPLTNFGFPKGLTKVNTKFYIKCLQELEKVKRKQMGKNSLFDVFTQYNDPLFSTNTEMDKNISFSKLENKFPIYASLLNTTFHKAKQRVVLLDAAQHVFNSPFPNEIRRHIISFLSDKDLRNVIQASKINVRDNDKAC